MQIVIDIPEVFYEYCKVQEDAIEIQLAVKNGIPLPKGHGKLKDIDKFIKRVEEDRKHECYLHSWTIDDVLQRLDSWYAPTIIEADNTRDCNNCAHSDGGQCAGTEVCHECMWDSQFIEADKKVIDPSNFGRFDMRMINRGKCMLCGKELTEGLFFCKECEAKAESKE